MLAVRGLYINGNIKLIEDVPIIKKQEVIVTFLDSFIQENYEEKIDINSFNFFNAQNQLKKFKGDLCKSLIEERRCLY
jgi:hypothetical protein